MLKVREIDVAILRRLLQDGRKSFVEIAAEIGATKTKIWKHFKEMEKKGIITGSTVQVNFPAIGFDAIATLLISVEGEKLNHTMEYIRRITDVLAYQQYNSIFNIRAYVTLKNINELDQIKEAIRLRIPANGIRTYIWTDVRNRPEYLFSTTNTKNTEYDTELETSTPTHNPPSKKLVDKLDIEIIEQMASNSRAPFNEIADKLLTSTDTVAMRYRKLKQNNIIKATIRINPNRIGYRSILDFNIALKSPIGTQITEALSRIPNIIIITKTSGDYDLQVTAMIKNIEQMFSIQEDIFRIPGVIKIETSARKIPTGWPTPKQYISTY